MPETNENLSTTPAACVLDRTVSEFHRGARALFDALHYRIANNWHPVHMKECDAQNAWASDWLEDALSEVSPEDASEWRSIHDAYKAGFEAGQRAR